MIIWLNGAFGAGKTTVAAELCRRLPGAFCYDPENIGYFLRQNTPTVLHTPDFQDMPLWRQINRQMLVLLGQYPGHIVVPMTLINWQYWQQIAGGLAEQGIRVEHFWLQADRETVIRRLKKRSLGLLKREQFALDRLDRCLTAFEQVPLERRIDTMGKSPGQIAEQIAACCGLTLTASQGPLSGKLNQLKTWAKHIRIR